MTVTALVLAVPVSILAAIYLSEYAPRRVREAAKPVIDLLAGLPSVVYGVWGVILVVPFVGGVLAPLAGVYSSGYSILAGGIVLAIMTFPTIIHVTLEVFSSVPRSLRDASLSLGATKWETTRHVVLRKGAQGILAAVRPRLLAGLRRDHGRAHGRRQRPGRAPVALRSRLPSAGAHRQQLRRDDVGAPLRRRPHDGRPGPHAHRPVLQRPGPDDPRPRRAEDPVNGAADRRLARRKRVDRLFRVLATGSAVAVLLSLLVILGTILWKSVPALDLAMLTRTPQRRLLPGQGGRHPQRHRRLPLSRPRRDRPGLPPQPAARSLPQPL
ncbi:MAG: ABC transporter permease subunit [Desulfosudis oleivorans]|nr:ABC transporter permease subunit [Desulfosudis oleivorans]